MHFIGFFVVARRAFSTISCISSVDSSPIFFSSVILSTELSLTRKLLCRAISVCLVWLVWLVWLVTETQWANQKARNVLSKIENVTKVDIQYSNSLTSYQSGLKIFKLVWKISEPGKKMNHNIYCMSSQLICVLTEIIFSRAPVGLKSC